MLHAGTRPGLGCDSSEHSALVFPPEFPAVIRCLLPATLLAMTLALPLNAAEPAAFPLKDGDVWVMAGDSITAQHLHSNYFEAFCYAR